jgi:hypothetical protein
MRHLRCRVPAARPPRANGAPIDPLGTRALDVQHCHAAADILGEARCPLCLVPLVARMGPQGPCFPCRCRPLAG